MDIRRHLAQQKIEDARQSVAMVHQKLLEEVTANRLAHEKFYSTITIVAAGALVLSVTYLGNIKAAGGKPVDFCLLKSTWASLLVCLAASVFYLNFHTNYVHYARFRGKAEKMKAYREAAMEDIDTITVVDEQGTQWTRSDLRKSLANEIAEFEKDVEWNKKKEDSWAGLYTWAGHIAQITFGLGLVLLLLFAIANS